MASFFFVLHKNNCVPNVERIDKLLTLNFWHLEAVYQHQIIMRNIDYITNQLVFLLVKMEQIIMNDDYDMDGADLPHIMFEKNMVEVIRKFWEPTFLGFNCYVNDALLYLKPWPWQQEYLRIIAPTATIFNIPHLSSNRFKTNNK